MSEPGPLPLHTGATRAAADLTERLLRSPGGPTGPRLIGIDGRSGTGKTTLAYFVLHSLARRETSAACVHMDELYAGWLGLADALPALRRQVLSPLRTGAPAAYRRWDWARGAYARHPVSLPSVDVVVVEGVGAVHADPAGYDLSVWLTAPTATRRERALCRDGEVFAPHWDSWAAQEDQLFGSRPEGPPPWSAQVILSFAGQDPGPG